MKIINPVSVLNRKAKLIKIKYVLLLTQRSLVDIQVILA